MRATARITGLVILLCSPCAMAEPSSSDPLELLRASHAALQQAERDFRVREAHGQLSPAERKDYADYLARLRQRLAEDCRVADATSVHPLPLDIPCVVPAAAPPSVTPVDPGTVRTQGESADLLETELGSALGEFDEMLLREQDRIKARTPRTDARAASGGGQGGGEDGGQDPGQAQGAAGQSASGRAKTGETGDTATAASGESRGGDKTSTGRASHEGEGGVGAKKRRGGEAPPPDIPSGDDDDVVARQLREAAEKERDPELKDKLWEEYRRYKRGTR